MLSGSTCTSCSVLLLASCNSILELALLISAVAYVSPRHCILEPTTLSFKLHCSWRIRLLPSHRDLLKFSESYSRYSHWLHACYQSIRKFASLTSHLFRGLSKMSGASLVAGSQLLRFPQNCAQHAHHVKTVLSYEAGDLIVHHHYYRQ